MRTIATITVPEGSLEKHDERSDLIYVKEEQMHEYKLMVKDPDTGSWARSQYIVIGHLIELLQDCIRRKGRDGFHWEEVIKVVNRLSKIENLELLRYVEDLEKIDRMLKTQHQKNAYLGVKAKENLAKIKEQKAEIEYYTGQISWYEQILGQMGAGQLLGERPDDADLERDDEDDYRDDDDEDEDRDYDDD